MRILFSGESLYPPQSGGDLSILTLLEKLAKEHAVEAIVVGDKNEVEHHNNIKINRVKTIYSKFPSWVKRYFLNKKWFKVLDDFLKNKTYDLIITQAVLAPASTIVSKKYNISVFFFIRGYENFCISHFRDLKKPIKHNCKNYASFKYRIQYPFFERVIKWQKEALRKADIIACNSKFVESIARMYGVKVDDVIYPVVDTKKYVTKRKNPKYITFITPAKRKGLDIFLKIVDKMPNEKFLVVGKAEKLNDITKRKNIKYIHWTNNMKKIYSITKIVLIPSTWFEPLPRVLLESMANGIPCIVSNKGGLPEGVNNAGIVINDIYNIDKWVHNIENVLKDENLYNKLLKKSKNQVKKFSSETQYKKFKKLIEKCNITNIY